MWENQEPDAPYIKDLEHPLGHLTFILSDSHGNRAHVACNVTRPVEDTSMVWEPVRRTDEIAVNVTLRTLLDIADSGLYHCFVRTDTNVDIVPYRLTVRMRLLSPSDLNGKKISVEKGDTLSLPCLVTSPHPIETRWFLPNNHIFKASDMKGRVYVSQNNTLIIKKVTYEDAGEYSCLAAN
uniref:Ig-like domain-containing protein n=1 Tax=Sinocyclocheilus grahami TaxID=75366 RepID=A0A672KHP8_SINGR